MRREQRHEREMLSSVCYPYVHLSDKIPTIALRRASRRLLLKVSAEENVSLLLLRCLHHRQTGFLPGRVATIYGLRLVALLAQQHRGTLPTRFAALVHVAIGNDRPIT